MGQGYPKPSPWLRDSLWEVWCTENRDIETDRLKYRIDKVQSARVHHDTVSTQGVRRYVYRAVDELAAYNRHRQYMLEQDADEYIEGASNDSHD